MIQSVDSVFEFLIKNKEGNYFRGFNQPSQMLPKIARHHELYKYEINMLQDFANIVVPYVKEIKTVRTLLELGQHYSLPTRLLDWTLDPFIALYFAIGKKDKIDASKIKIACMNTKTIPLTDVSEVLDQPTILSEMEPMRLNDLNNFMLNEVAYFGMEKKFENLLQYLKSYLFTQKYNEFINSVHSHILFSYKKDYLIERKEAQKGAFLLFDNHFKELPIEFFNIFEFDLSAKEKFLMLTKLDEIGINKISLFPNDFKPRDIELSCKSIGIKYQVKE